MPWIEIQSPAPVLNTPDFAAVFGGIAGTSLPLNQKGHPFHYEFVALPGMRFEFIKEMSKYIIAIRWPAYSLHPLFIDHRFCQWTDIPPSELRLDLSPVALLAQMEKRLGTPYVWGGNFAEGVPAMLEYYPPRNSLDPRTSELWTFRGLDCSGLLFEASKGATPRNTSHLLQYGRSLLPQESLQPLDMILYPGHVLFVRDELTIIESKSPFGVRICSLEHRLEEITRERQFIRDWIPPIDPTTHFTFRRFI